MSGVKRFVLIMIGTALCGVPQAQTFEDSFDAPRNYLTEGVGDTIWDGFLGLAAGETVNQLNASNSRPGELVLSSAGGFYHEPWEPLGPFLYKVVSGDFVARVKVSAYQNIMHNNCGLMARALRDPDLAGPGEDWVSMDYFPIYNCGNFVRNADNNSRTELCHNGLAWNADTWLQLEKQGATFHFRHSPDGVNWTELACSPVTRSDLADIPLQVGLFQCTYSSNLGYAAFDHFALTVTEPQEQDPPSWTEPPITLDPGTRLVDNSSAVKGLPAFLAGQWDNPGQMDGWTTSGLMNISVVDGTLTAAASTDAPCLQLASIAGGPDLDFGYFDYLQFRLRLPIGLQDDMVIYYGTSAAPGIHTGSTRNLLIPAESIPQDGQWHTYRLDLGLAVRWRDRLTDLRIYPLGKSANGLTFSIDYLEVGDLPGDVLLINTDLNIHDGESFSDLEYMESKHAVFWWSPQSYQRHSSFDPEVMGRRTLRMIEESYQVFCKKLNYLEPFESFDAWRRDGNRYKINHITWYDGFWCGGWNGFMHIGVNGWGLQDEGWGNPVPHEFGHYIQGHQPGFLTGGHWESHANFLRNARNIHYAEILGNISGMIDDRIFDATNFRQDHGSLIYHDFRIHHALQDFGADAGTPNAVADVWIAGPKEQTIYTKLASLLPSGTSVGDVVAAGLRHWPFLDFSVGDTLKSIFWNGGAKEAMFKYRIGSHLIPLHDKPGWYRVPFERAPERFAYMVHPLTPTADAVTVELRGFDLVGTTEDWRWSLVAADDNWNTPRYSEVFAPGVQTFQLNSDETRLFLIVVAAPTDTRLNLEWTDNALPVDKHPDRLRYAYEVGLDGATAAVAERQYSTPLPAGRIHANGGGFVAHTATVASTAYVGPNARVLGSARVLNAARVEDYAVVTESATVQNNAVVSGHALVRGSANVRDNARIRDRADIHNATVRDNAKVQGYANVSGNAMVRDYAIVRGCSTISGGTLSGTGIADYDYSGGTLSDGVHFSHVPWGEWYQDYWWNTLSKPRGLTASYRIEETEGQICRDEFGAAHALLRGRPRRLNDLTLQSVYLRLNGINQYMVLDRGVCDVLEGGFSLRIKPDFQTPQPLVFIGSSGSASMRLVLNGDSKAEFTITNGSNTTVLTSLSDIPAGQWTLLTVMLSGTQGVLYVNGIPEAQSPTSLVPEQVFRSNSYEQPAACYVGRDETGALFRGGIDDVRFYNVAMTFAEVQNEARRIGSRLAARFYDDETDFDGQSTRIESGVRNGLKRRLTADIFPRTSGSVSFYEGIFDSNDERSSQRPGSGVGLNSGTFRVRLDGLGMWNTYVPVTLNQWQTITLEFDGSWARFYVNGSLRASRSYSANPNALAAKNYRIGFAMDDSGNTYHFDGKIRNLQIIDLADSVPVQPPQPDINGDGAVDIWDFLELAAHWLCADCSKANHWCVMTDLNRNGTVDLEDFNMLCTRW